jgi:hypothetical protein
MGYAFNTNIYKTQTSEIEVQMAQVIRNFALQHFGHCTCTTMSCCDLCHFLQLLENCSGFINYDNLLNKPHFLQSQAIDKNSPEEGQNTSRQANVAFDDDGEDPVTDIPFDMNHYRVDNSQSVDLGDYLSRPVKVYSKTWTVGSTLDITSDNFTPWLGFFSHTPILKKLDNYYMVRCNLHLKFVINASPFYYGAAIACYQPLTNFNPGPIVISTGQEMVQLSQRPHIWLYPQDSQGGEIKVPFLYHKNWLNATSATDLTNMGKVSLQSVGALLNANGLGVGDVEISCFAWATDVEVAGPTIALAVQSKGKKKSKDEYSQDGVVSKPASAVAHAAGLLKEVPIIGPFATATQHAAEAVASIASLFGFTNTPVIDDIHQFQPTPFPNLASTDIGMPIDKLTVDAKNELSIDPCISGVQIDDELLISNLVQREAWIFDNVWTAANTANTGLFHAFVSPMMLRNVVNAQDTLRYFTPCAYVNNLFGNWRGDMIFRFKFICSKFHRGRVQINWDPIGDIGVTGNYTTQTYSRIIDITEETDVEILVPYTQPTSYLKTPDFGTHFGKTDTGTTDVGTIFNGIITMRVLNKQTSPVASADIRYMVFVRGADNLEFANPRNLLGTLSPYATQSKPFDKQLDEKLLGVSSSEADKNLNLIYMGERVVSLRQLMRRQCKYRSLVGTTTASATDYVKFRHELSRLPIYPGFDTSGLDQATGLVSLVAESYNWVNWTPLTFISLCFVGIRGSIIYSLNVHSHDTCGHVSIDRREGDHTVTESTLTTTMNTLPLLKSRLVVQEENSSCGVTITNQQTQAGITALVPMYSRFKFLMNSSLYRTEGTSADGSNKDCVRVVHTHTNPDASARNVIADLYVGAGTDVSLIFFLNTPALWDYDSYPTPL